MRLECYVARVYNAIDVIVNHTQKKIAVKLWFPHQKRCLYFEYPKPTPNSIAIYE